MNGNEDIWMKDYDGEREGLFRMVQKMNRNLVIALPFYVFT